MFFQIRASHAPDFDDLRTFLAKRVKNANAEIHPIFNGGSASTASKSVFSGQTYLAQMLAHELVSSTSSPTIKRRPFFTLDSIYGNKLIGNTVADTGHVFDSALFTEEGFFKYRFEQLEICDFERPFGSKLALSADKRNDQNLFVSQLHLLWLRFHNAVLRYIEANAPHTFALMTRAERIQATRKIITQVFQIAVFEECLKPLVPAFILNGYKDMPAHEYLLNDKSLIAAPVVFSDAVMRFGHSMVRKSYRPNLQVFSKNLSSFFKHVEPQIDPISQQTNWRVAKNQIVNWNMFFKGNDSYKGFHNEAMLVDRFISNDMSTSPLDSSHVNILKHNLYAGIHSKVPSANQLFDYLITKQPTYLSKLGLAWFTPEVLNEACKRPKSWNIGDDMSAQDLPINSLWLYMLNEKEVYKHDQFPDDLQHHEKLGPLSSIIFCEVVLNAFRHSPLPIIESYWRNKGELALSEHMPSDIANKIKSKKFKMLDIYNFVEQMEKIR
jgi:hypothetical protein